MKSEKQWLGKTSVAGALVLLMCSYFVYPPSASANTQKKKKLIISVERFKANPIIKPEMLPGDEGKNINGPSLIKVPD